MKKLGLFLVMAIALMVLAACGSEESKDTSSGSAEAASDKIELTYWYAWGDKIGENNENLVKQFNESQDKIHVTAEFQGTYDELHAKTQAAFAAGNAPEVTQNEIASMGVFAKSGMTQDLTSFIENDKEINMDDFNPGLMGNSYVDDKVYGLPYLRSTPILYMNATMAEEVGLDPAGPKTWEEFEEYAKAFTNGEGRVGMSLPIDIWFYEAHVAQAGGTMMNEDNTEVAFNSPEGAAAFDFWRNMSNEGTMKLSSGTEAGDKAKQDFVNGHSGMLFSSTADLSYLLQLAEEKGFDLQTYFMPKGKEAKVPTGGANLVMTSGLDEEKQQAAWEFIKFMTATEQTAYASEYTGYLPSRLSAAESEKMQALYKEKPQFKVAVDQLENGIARPMAENYPEVVKILIDEMTRGILDESIPTEEVLDTAAEKANAVLK
ncbi:ABC transporter substrate-binding protein [Planococcus shenhongbingii]|uniref:ABC transporter substrate-binding protein n=1 Tax=Planococcus shenhongbingii TaxID=3058398 RepID=A0ABT8NB95_9BACL|nr:MULTISPECIES: ABC transporter substrate-binding protein [unclassified Planococcus (in: firmicutes)]MDN7245155.1 ABC transporter substrate-binding protein [Planococcus sp. N017]WKA58250.1 ABC transporter substrate-binding protein [Planococcus sp. N016]